MALTVLIGGARSGKSSMAVRAAKELEQAVVFVATAEALDAEFELRIARHRAQRPANWRLVEEPLALEEVLLGVPEEATVIVDCLSLWVANLIGREEGESEIVETARRAAKLASGRRGATLVVTNEVGLGIVPANSLARQYRDVLGRVNLTFALAADRALFVVAGMVLPLASWNGQATG
jgi:adenosyl cobinamide kinase/adenosyl cobinamide phosphate guanylyltransferase